MRPFDETNGEKVISELPGDGFEYHIPKRRIRARKNSRTILCNRTVVDLPLAIPASRDQYFEITIL